MLFTKATCVDAICSMQGDSSVHYLELTDKEPFLVESWLLCLMLLILNI